jgi:hypothetical protein
MHKHLLTTCNPKLHFKKKYNGISVGRSYCVEEIVRIKNGLYKDVSRETFLKNINYFSGNTGEFSLQTPKYF